MSTLRVLELSDGNCSLELGEISLAVVKTRIEELWGVMETGSYLASQSVRFGDCDFLFQKEWDDPCLISLSTEGAAHLRRLAQSLSGILP